MLPSSGFSTTGLVISHGFSRAWLVPAWWPGSLHSQKLPLHLPLAVIYLSASGETFTSLCTTFLDTLEADFQQLPEGRFSRTFHWCGTMTILLTFCEFLPGSSSKVRILTMGVRILFLECSISHRRYLCPLFQSCDEEFFPVRSISVMFWKGLFLG